MSKIRKKELKHFSGYFIATVLPSILGLGLVPVYTRYLGPSDYGVLSILSILVFVIRPIILHGASREIEIGQYQLAENEFAQLVSRAIFNGFIVFLGISLLTYWFRDALTIFFFPNLDMKPKWLLAIPLLGYSFALNSIASIVLRNARLPRLFLLLNMGKSLLDHGASVVLIILFYFAWQGRISGQITSAVFIIVFVLLFLRYRNLITSNLGKFKPFSRFKVFLPLLLIDFATLGIESADRLFISYMIPDQNSSVGLYSVGYLVGGVVLYFINAYTNLFSPDVFQRLKSNDESLKVSIVKRFYMFFALALFISGAIFLLNDFFFDYLIGPKFSTSRTVVPWVAFGLSFQVFFLLGYNICMFSNFSNIPSRITVLAFGINAIGNFFLIGEYGFVGAAISTFFTYIIMGLGMLIVSQSFVALPWFYFLSGKGKLQ